MGLKLQRLQRETPWPRGEGQGVGSALVTCQAAFREVRRRAAGLGASLGGDTFT